jgi:hypothetical protein
MQKYVTTEIIASFREHLENHPIYETISTIYDLQCFMEHHVYAVWDFMSLLKYLQSVAAPSTLPWMPEGLGNAKRFINELVLNEESDETNIEGEYISHFELYRDAMQEIGADISSFTDFLNAVQEHGITNALKLPYVPPPSRKFTSKTFRLMLNDKPHQAAAAFALGREYIIPWMFLSIVQKMGISEKEAPAFHLYLNRHIQSDADHHAPLSLKLLNVLCEGDQRKIEEAVAAASQAVTARIDFWDGVLGAMHSRRNRVA